MTRVSVVIPTEAARPDSLARALLALTFQRHPDFEVVVAGPPGCLDAPGPATFRDRVRLAPAPPGNVSAARNAGIAAAAGEVVAFLDDDAVPEPGWLEALVKGFLAPGIGGVGGFVLGPNGVDWQTRGLAVDPFGFDHGLPDEPFAAPRLPEVPEGCAVKTPGTNCAFRRSALEDAGGFDAAFRFFHDETDIDRRLAALGWRIALAPRAVVHHGMDPSPRRARGRVPRDLFEVGASQALFLRRHAPADGHDPALAWFRERRRAGLVRGMLAGLLEPRDVRRLMAGLDAGIADGRTRAFVPAVLSREVAGGWLAFPVDAPLRGCRCLFDCGAGVPRAALEAARAGAEVTVLAIGPGPRRLSVWFEAPGLWRHRGGALGRPRRDETTGPLSGRAARRASEAARIGLLRAPKTRGPGSGEQ